MNTQQAAIIPALRHRCCVGIERETLGRSRRSPSPALRRRAVCILDVSSEPARSRIMVFFSDEVVRPPGKTGRPNRIKLSPRSKRAKASPLRLKVEVASDPESNFAVVVHHRDTTEESVEAKNHQGPFLLCRLFIALPRTQPHWSPRGSIGADTERFPGGA